MNKKTLTFHFANFYYMFVPIIFYIFVRNIVFFFGTYAHWNALIINLVSGVINLIGLYIIFYRSFEQKRILTYNLPEKKVQRFGPYIWVLLAGGSACLFLNNLVLLLGLRQQIVSYEKVSQAIYSGNYALVAIQVVFIAALVEELLFRGLIYRAACLSIGVLPAAFLSSFIFAVMHGNLLQGIYAFIFGLVLVYALEQFQSMTAAILCHMAANLISVIGTKTFCLQFMYQSMAVMVGFTVMMGMMFLLCLIKIDLIKYQKKYKNVRKEEKAEEK